MRKGTLGEELAAQPRGSKPIGLWLAEDWEGYFTERRRPRVGFCRHRTVRVIGVGSPSAIRQTSRSSNPPDPLGSESAFKCFVCAAMAEQLAEQID
jgi:hypothetical protein